MASHTVSQAILAGLYNRNWICAFGHGGTPTVKATAWDLNSIGFNIDAKDHYPCPLLLLEELCVTS